MHESRFIFRTRSDKGKGKGVCICASYLWKSISQLRSVTCRMWSHSVTCHPTQANTPRLHPSPTGWYSIYRPFKGAGLSKPRPRVQRTTGPLLLRDSPELARTEPTALRLLVQHANHLSILEHVHEQSHASSCTVYTWCVLALAANVMTSMFLWRGRSKTVKVKHYSKTLQNYTQLITEQTDGNGIKRSIINKTQNCAFSKLQLFSNSLCN